MKRAMIGILCAALVAPLVWTARARGADPPADGFARHRALFEEGQRLYGEGRWAEARAVFLEIWAMRKSYDVAAYLGDIELMLGEPRSAAEHLTYALRTLPVGAKPVLRQTLSALLEEARRLVGVLRVQVNEPGAEVVVDGRTIGYAPIDGEVFVEPGAHALTAKREGYADATANVEAKAGGAYEVTLTLEPAATLTAPRATAVPMPSREARAVEVAPEMRRSWVPVIALGAASAVGLGVAVGFTVASNEASADAHAYSAALARANEQCIKPHGEFAATCEQTSNAASRAGTLGDVAFASYVISGGLALAAVAYTVWPVRKKTPDAGVRLAPFGGMGAAGILAAGAW